MAWLGIIFHLDGYVRAGNSSCLDPFYSYLLIPEEKKIIWSELESSPLTSSSQASALTTRPWLLGLKKATVLKAVLVLAIAQGRAFLTLAQPRVTLFIDHQVHLPLVLQELSTTFHLTHELDIEKGQQVKQVNI